MKWASAIRLRATPTVIVNGWRLSRIPDIDELMRVIEAVEAGEAPYGSQGDKE